MESLNYHDAPEVNNNASLPEVYNPPDHHQQNQHIWSIQQQQHPQHLTSPTATTATHSLHALPTDLKAEPQHAGYAVDSAAPSTLHQYGLSEARNTDASLPERRKGANLVCGCTAVVLVLSIVVAILAAAVIGLAAGTGIAVRNYNDATSQVESLSASVSSLEAAATRTTSSTTSSAAPTATSFSDITNGCSDRDETTTGENYTPLFFDRPTFTMFCNADAPNPQLYSLFTADFNGCMDACAAWNSYNASRTECRGVSFIPLWSNVTIAAQGQAPGDCYLKPGPQSRSNLGTPNIGTECHAAILESSRDDE